MSLDARDKKIMSVEEFLHNLSMLTDADRNRLMIFSTHRCRFCRFEAEDLLSEAITRTIEGIRNCPFGVDVVKYLFETMRSIVSSEIKSLERHRELSLTTEDSNAISHQIDVHDNSLSPEQQVILKFDAERIKRDIINLFNDDEVSQFIIECWSEELTPEETRDATGLNKREYDSKCRKIRRRINASYPRGYTNE